MRCPLVRKPGWGLRPTIRVRCGCGAYNAQASSEVTLRWFAGDRQVTLVQFVPAIHLQSCQRQALVPQGPTLWWPSSGSPRIEEYATTPRNSSPPTLPILDEHIPDGLDHAIPFSLASHISPIHAPKARTTYHSHEQQHVAMDPPIATHLDDRARWRLRPQRKTAALLHYLLALPSTPTAPSTHGKSWRLMGRPSEHSRNPDYIAMKKGGGAPRRPCGGLKNQIWAWDQDDLEG